jgi:ABC-type Fe3+-hydroxamate transport system substrate-binding protein
MRDAAGTLHAPSGRDARIVCLVPSITELVCDLGLAPQLVGRTGLCIHPRDRLNAIPKVGGTKDVNLDEICALAPTHVILNIDENEKRTAEALAEFVPHLIVTHPLGPLDNPALYRLIGGIFGKEREAEALCARFGTALARLRDAAKAFAPQRVLYLIWKRPWMTVSRDTYIARTLALANWHSIPAAVTARYPEIELDAALLDDADLVLLSTEPFRFREPHVAELKTLPPLRGKPVLLVDGEMISWYGSRAIEAMGYLREFRRAAPP